MGELSSKFICINFIVLFVCANGNVMMNYEMSNSNHIPVATYSGMRDRGYSRNYQYPNPPDDLPSPSSNNWSGGRQLSSLAATSLQSAASSDYYGATANDNHAAASGHGWSKDVGYSKDPGYSKDNGFNKDTGPSYGKEGCNSALGLLGVLGLASYLQNVLRQMTTTVAAVRPVVPVVPGRRRRREAIGTDGSSVSIDKTQSLTKDIDDITNKIIPLLTAVGHARDGLIPLRCTRRHVCLANQLLANELEEHGKSIGIVLSTAIGKMLKEVDKTGTVVKEIATAAKAGRNGEKCRELYSSCPSLSGLPIYRMPSNSISH